MRSSFAKELELKMQRGNTFLLTGDLGYSVFEGIKEKFKDQYLNMGLAEQNMLGVAAGMASLDKEVFIYSIIPFLIYRGFEQLRNDICYQNLPIRLVGVGAGLAYADAGFTHHAIDDYGILRSLPNLTILNPADPSEVTAMMKAVENVNGPVYMRLGRNGEPILHNKHGDFKIGKALEITTGNDILIIVSGSLLKVAIEVSELLENGGISVEILDYHTIKPFNRETLLSNITGKKLLVIIEEHLSETGIASIVSQTILENRFIIDILTFGIREPLYNLSGSREYLLSKYGLDVNSIYNKILNSFREKEKLG